MRKIPTAGKLGFFILPLAAGLKDLRELDKLKTLYVIGVRMRDSELMELKKFKQYYSAGLLHWRGAGFPACRNYPCFV